MSSITDQHTEWFSERFNAVLVNVERVIRGKSDQIATALVALFAEGHLLLDDVPGTGKTTLAKSIARSMQASSGRIQFTPDLLPSDVTGGMVYDQSNGTFEFRPGPIFANVVLADEINRASPKTQAALLEVMEERHVTIDGESRPVPRPFIVIATQNPVEQEGTYRLPEAQLDRFLLRTSIGYPDLAAEVDAVKRVTAGAAPSDLEPVVSVDDVREMIAIAGHVHVDDSIYDYVVRLVAASRTVESLRLGASTRGALALVKASRTLAATQGRPYVTVDDVKVLAPAALAHRLLLSPDAELRGVDPADLVDDLLDRIDIPTPVRSS
ncbi:AAA family ATPase [Ilumatobacter nonamiensis]|uniref:AAA family ATPase n=1 Tax=Ilumatobacter nonamiensis TaxID=467093 RepID=UPI000345BE94|nr:MoxR family ATPase [Ilumatobacter nonamiensis]